MKSLPLILYLAGIALISYGATGGNQAHTWPGFGAILFGGAITPALRFRPNEVEGTTHDYLEETEGRNG